MKQVIAKLECIEVVHELDYTGKKYIESYPEMLLYPEQIEIKNEVFPIHKLYDISYRMNSKENGIGYLYLHTDNGVRTFHTRCDPQQFIDAFKIIAK